MPFRQPGSSNGHSGTAEVEVMRLYLNRHLVSKRLTNARDVALSERRLQVPAARRLHMTLLDAPATAEPIDAYRAGARIKDLARRFDVHRTTVTSLLLRHDVELRPVGLSPVQVHDAARLYRDGWSLARLGEKFGADDMTVRRYLLLAGVVMRSPYERHH
jgi:hypothetical protein